jgi:biotin carboxylase
MKAALPAAGLPVADHRFGPVTSIPAMCRSVGFPAVMKPNRGAGSVNITLVRDEQHLARLLAAGAFRKLADRSGPVVVEAFVEMRAEYHCDAIMTEGRTTFSSVSRYLRPMLETPDATNGSVVLPPGPAADGVSTLAADAVSALGLRDGVTHLEVFETADGLIVGEVAARPGDGGVAHAVRADSGVDNWQVLADVHLGIPFAEPVRGRDRIRDCPHSAGCRAERAVVSLTPASELHTIVKDTTVRFNVRLGDIVDRPAGVTFWVGTVNYPVPDFQTAERVAQAVWSHFQVTTESSADSTASAREPR